MINTSACVGIRGGNQKYHALEVAEMVQSNEEGIVLLEPLVRASPCFLHAMPLQPNYSLQIARACISVLPPCHATAAKLQSIDGVA
jgi:hypothetical protein